MLITEVNPMSKKGVVMTKSSKLNTVFLKEIEDFDGMKVDIILIDDEPMFELYSTGMALGQVKAAKGKLYPRKERIARTLELAEITAVVYDGELYLTEDMLYDFMLEARTEKCKKFRKWITKVVLPSIRKDGMYISDDATSDQIDFNIKLLDKTFKSCPLEDLENVYKECIEFHKVNKTRLEYRRSSVNRRSDKLRTVSDSRIIIMEKIKDTVEDRVILLEHAGFREPLVNLVGKIGIDIKTIQHNRTKGNLVRRTIELEDFRNE